MKRPNAVIYIESIYPIHQELYDGNKLCDVLPQCKKFRINGNWLQLFYDDGEKYLIFKISNSPKLSSIN